MASKDTRGSGRTMKILSREDRESDRDRERDRDSRRRDDKDRRRDRDSESKPVQGPIVLLKRPDKKTSNSGQSHPERGEPGATSSDVSINKHGHGPTSILVKRSGKKEHDSSDSATVEKGKTGPPPISEILKPAYQFPGGKAMTLIDSNMKICPWKNFDYDAHNYPSNMDYLVVTVIGRPNVGKSTILSYLAGDEKFGSSTIFPPRKREEEMQSSVYISSNQIVFIELSSVYNQSSTNDLIPLVSQQGVLEVSNVTWNLRLVRWALSVSHMILVVSENVFEPNVFQLMNSAEIIHPMDSALGENSYPEPIFVCNKADLELMDRTDVINEFQKHFTSVTGRTPRIPQNYYILPHVKYETEHHRVDTFKRSIMEFNRYNRAPFAPEKESLTKLVQKHNIQDWYQNASRLWEEMNLPSFFSSYVKLLP